MAGRNRKEIDENLIRLRKMSAKPNTDMSKHNADVWQQSRNYRRLAKKLEKKGVK